MTEGESRVDFRLEQLFDGGNDATDVLLDVLVEFGTVSLAYGDQLFFRDETPEFEARVDVLPFFENDVILRDAGDDCVQIS